jgi:hypothetical protein
MYLSDAGSHIRKIKLYIPSSESPLMTTYGKMMLPKLSPMKHKYEIFSNRTEKIKNLNPETEYISANELNGLNKSF